MKKQFQYILLTPSKDEEKNLPSLIESIAGQSIPPVVWLIIDNGSEDKSAAIIKSYAKKYDWIKYLYIKNKKRDLRLNIAKVCRAGFKYLINYCNSHNKKYDYIARIDADMIPEKRYYEKVISIMDKNENLGVASGLIYYKKNNKIIYERKLKRRPCGGAMVFRRKTFEDIDGIPITYAEDSIAILKSVLKGWDVQELDIAKTCQSRPTSSAEGLWKGYRVRGETDYYIGKSPLFAFLKGLNYSFRYPFYFGAPYFHGYLDSFIKKNPKIKDKEVLDYHSNLLKKRVMTKLRGLDEK